MNLHPEFIAYWNKKGCSISLEPEKKVYSDHSEGKEWMAKSASCMTFTVAYVTEHLDGTYSISYHLYVNHYNYRTEKEMLQYVRLQAFI